MKSYQLSVQDSPPNRVEPLHSRISSAPDSQSSRTAGLILAGGAGRRFGGPKAFARLPDGRTFLEACADVQMRIDLIEIQCPVSMISIAITDATDAEIDRCYP